MSATTPAKRQSVHASSGGEHRKRSYVYLYVGGAIFLAAWLVWTIWLGSPLPL